MKKTITRRVYQRDLYDDKVSYNVRLDSDEFVHGDLIKIEVQKITEDDVTEEDNE